MHPPRLTGLVQRRLLVNYRVDAEVAARLLPAPFRPQLVEGFAVAGICLIRLSALRPAGMPARLGFTSENAAHRFAVEWDQGGRTCHGVWIPRRDTASRLTAIVGGRLFPGEHGCATFDVAEQAERLQVGYRSVDRSVTVAVDIDVQRELSGSRLFADVATASAFFEAGSCGYSATSRGQVHQGLELQTSAWTVAPGRIRSVTSSFFDDPAQFPPGSATPDCALVMRDVPVTWRALADLPASAPEQLSTSG